MEEPKRCIDAKSEPSQLVVILSEGGEAVRRSVVVWAAEASSAQSPGIPITTCFLCAEAVDIPDAADES